MLYIAILSHFIIFLNDICHMSYVIWHMPHVKWKKTRFLKYHTFKAQWSMDYFANELNYSRCLLHDLLQLYQWTVINVCIAKLSTHHNIPNSQEGRNQKVRKFKTIYYHSRVFFTKIKNENEATTVVPWVAHLLIKQRKLCTSVK